LEGRESLRGVIVWDVVYAWVWLSVFLQLAASSLVFLGVFKWACMGMTSCFEKTNISNQEMDLSATPAMVLWPASDRQKRNPGRSRSADAMVDDHGGLRVLRQPSPTLTAFLSGCQENAQSVSLVKLQKELALCLRIT